MAMVFSFYYRWEWMLGTEFEKDFDRNHSLNLVQMPSVRVGQSLLLSPSLSLCLYFYEKPCQSLFQQKPGLVV